MTTRPPPRPPTLGRRHGAGFRVLQVVTDTDRRGAQIFAAELGPALERHGHTVRTVALAPGARRPGLPVPVLGRSRRGLATLRRLRHLLRSADVVVGFGSTTLPACALAALGTGVPFVYRSIGELGYWADTPARRVRVRLGLTRASAVVALWPDAARTITEDFGVADERLHVIPRGVPAAAFPCVRAADREAARRSLGLPVGPPTLTVVGSLSPEKNVAAAVSVVKDLPHCQLLVVGDGGEREDLEALACRVAAGRVHFTGAVDDLTPVLTATDVVVLPSHSEGMPGVLIEAGLSCLPVVATDVGGVRHIVVPGVTGEVVAPGDVGQLRDGIVSALEHGPNYGNAARRRCLEHFEMEVVASEWNRLLAALAGRS